MATCTVRVLLWLHACRYACVAVSLIYCGGRHLEPKKLQKFESGGLIRFRDERVTGGYLTLTKFAHI